MKHQPRFLGVIFHLKVDNLCVTHPFATTTFLVLLQEKLPFDLHVLGTPPAFTLSQDQTLHKKKIPSACNTIPKDELQHRQLPLYVRGLSDDSTLNILSEFTSKNLYVYNNSRFSIGRSLILPSSAVFSAVLIIDQRVVKELYRKFQKKILRFTIYLNQEVNPSLSSKLLVVVQKM